MNGETLKDISSIFSFEFESGKSILFLKEEFFISSILLLVNLLLFYLSEFNNN